MATWFARMVVHYKNDRKTVHNIKVTDSVDDFAVHQSRYYPGVQKIEWVPTKPDPAKAGPGGPSNWDVADGDVRAVEFDDNGKVKSRTPDDDAAHRGGPVNEVGSVTGDPLAEYRKRTIAPAAVNAPARA